MVSVGRGGKKGKKIEGKGRGSEWRKVERKGLERRFVG